jgi:hypothetical protein
MKNFTLLSFALEFAILLSQQLTQHLLRFSSLILGSMPVSGDTVPSYQDVDTAAKHRRSFNQRSFHKCS